MTTLIHVRLITRAGELIEAYIPHQQGLQAGAGVKLAVSIPYAEHYSPQQVYVIHSVLDAGEYTMTSRVT